MKIKAAISKAGMTLKKHSPAILTGVGVVGLGATAYLAYKSREKVEAVVVDIEEKRANDVPVDKVEVAKDIAEAIYLPVTVGIVSVGAIVMSFRIQKNRIATLATALAAQQAHSLYFERKYRKVHGEEAYAKFRVPTEEVEVEGVDSKGKPKMSVQEVKKEIDKSIGQWFDQSAEFASDDHTYNVAYIDAANDRMQNILFHRGTLLLNEVFEALGFERTRNGALLGWTSSDSFDIEKVVTELGREEMGELKQQIWVTWSRPSYIHDKVDFNGRYSPY